MREREREGGGRQRAQETDWKANRDRRSWTDSQSTLREKDERREGGIG